MKTAFLEQLIGQMVGSCRVETLLHHGRTSAVYRAVKPEQRLPVAITLFLLPESLSAQVYQRFMARFMAEAAKLMAVRHPHLLPLYEYGEYGGFPYLTTPYITDGSLAQAIQQQGRYTPAMALRVLEQVAAGLDYAHHYGLVHRTLKPEHILLPKERPIQIAGLGLVSLLERRGLIYDNRPYSHLQTITGTTLVSQRYLAPECMQGEPGDARSDIYALGVILFEMLSGAPPFNQGISSEVMMQQGERELPDLHTRYADISPALDTVLHQALAWQPTARFQSVSDLLTAFRYGVQGKVSVPVNKCGDSPVCSNCAFGQANAMKTTATPPSIEAYFSPEQLEDQQWLSRMDKQAGARSYVAKPSIVGRHRSSRTMNRRRVLAFLIGGTSVAVAGLGLGLYGLQSMSNGAHLVPAMTNVNVPGTNKRTGAKKNVIGSKQQVVNTAQQFINPHDGKESLLIRLPSGVFVAYERACTHVGVQVNYDTGQHLLVCPAHGSIFDPTRGGSVVQGPAMQPLPQVPVHMNADGTVTV